MLTEHLASLGIMAWPLLITSCLGLAMILERLVTYALLPSLSRKGLTELFNEVRQCCGGEKHAQSKSNLCQNLCKGKGIRQGIAVLLSHNTCEKTMREEVAGLWLLKQKRSLNAWLKPLMLIGVLSPMLGLLGTVLGMIDMFRDIAAVAGPVTPDILAAGLWQAMFTTAFGLIIAIPALAAAHGFGVWANHYLAKLEFALNHSNLLLEGLAMDDDGLATAPSTAVVKNVSVKNNRASSTISQPEIVAAGAVAA
ncbi:MotA/TolQ/ExbB proton channel family protein [Endozoicomonas sp. SESOKO1]|uniref:MotA/TolQ/ExbB proton channel family protein n=1 Tax=Endozoicomonas sp. SESOKO1 TaxID=2828742 RepID=UPI0021474E7C|nr:MotA/TolQ/ExbB proton channel family protein [Endozoicomonas sp. SESOKO1]